MHNESVLLSTLLLLLAAPTVGECARVCLAPLSTIGMDSDEQAAFETAMMRALNAPRCAEFLQIDDACFSNDDCLQRVRADRPGFVVAHAVRAGSELRVTWAVTKLEHAVERGQLVAPPLAFLASGHLDDNIARGQCVAQSADPPTTQAPAATNETPSPAPPSFVPSLKVIGMIGGGAVVAVSAVTLGASLALLETPSAAGSTKEVSTVFGWAAVVGVLVGSAIASTALAVYLADDAR